MLEIHLVLLFMIAASITAVVAKDLLSSVIAIGAVGIGLCMAFFLLKAPDLAMLQLVVEILSLIMLVRATTRKDLPFSRSGRWIFNTVSTAVFVVVFIAWAFIALRNIPAFGNPEMRVAKMALDEGLKRAAGLNIVSMVASSIRVFDTLGEVTILFAAIVGVLAVARRISHEK